MPEPFISDTTPTSSPILAYGESSPSLIGRFGVIVGGIVATVLVACAIAIVAAWNIPLPSSPSIAIGIAANTSLPSTAPEIWRTAQQRARPLPIIVGFAGAGHQTPFVIAPRYALSNAVAHTAIWGLEGENLGVDTTTTSMTSLAPKILSWPWLRIWPMRLFPVAGTSSSDESVSIAGSISGSSWLTDLPAPANTVASAFNIEGQNGVDLVAIPEAWPFILNMFHADGLALDQETMPSVLRWSRGADGNLVTALTFSDAVPSNIPLLLKAAAGSVSKKSLKLADGDVIEELVAPPTDQPESTSSTTGTSEMALTYTTDTVFIGDMQAVTVPWIHPIDCPGTKIAFFTIPQISTFFQASRIVWTVDRGHVRVCWE